MWHRDLLTQLRQQAPRWRWVSKLGARGGELDGTAQKGNLHIEIGYARGTWSYVVHKLYGRLKPQWVLMGEGTTDQLVELVGIIVEYSK